MNGPLNKHSYLDNTEPTKYMLHVIFHLQLLALYPQICVLHEISRIKGHW